DWLESCQRFRAFARDDQLILPGHKLPYTGLPVRLPQMIENHESALERLMVHLTQPRRALDCFVAIFKREIGPAEQGLALVEAVAHLNCLLRRGLVLRSLGPTGAWEWECR
ncbi:MAG TPA: MBL fold metallo-hydrolase, partial [Tabrizicola sp.]|nr:MBL fold metallo-hydrolase [Tabrizicola sp.]